jgi:hypothetical protein
MSLQNRTALYIPIGLITVSSITVLTLYAVLGLFAYPSADDFCMVSGVEQMGLFGYLQQHYLDWSGRYSGNAFYGIYPLLLGLFSGYPWLATLLIIALITSFAFALAGLFVLPVFNRKVLLVSLVLTAVYLLGLRHTASSFYWMAGALTYQSANILLLLTLGMGLRLLRQPGDNKNTAGLALLLVLGMGANENNMIVLLFLVLLLLLALHRPKSANPTVGYSLLGLTLLCFLVVYLSPGNAERESTFPLRHDLMRSLEGSLRMGGWTLMAWITQPYLIIASLLLPFAAHALQTVSTIEFRPGARSIIFLAVVTLGFPFLLQFPAWWSMGGWPPPRTVDAIFFIFLLCWSLLIGALGLRYLPREQIFDKQGDATELTRYVTGGLSLLFIIGVGLNTRLQSAWVDLNQHAPDFRDYMQQRHSMIQSSIDNGVYSLQVPAYRGEPPRSVFFNDIRPDWRDWRNGCYARYFGLTAIQREPQPGPSR